MSYEYFEHTADVKFVAKAKSLEEAFVCALQATTGVVYEGVGNIRDEIKHDVEIEANTHRALLYDFLEEALFVLDTKAMLVCNARNLKITEDNGKYFLRCTFVGDDYKNYETMGLVKSITYNQMKITQEDSGWKLQVVLDI